MGMQHLHYKEAITNSLMSSEELPLENPTCIAKSDLCPKKRRMTGRTEMDANEEGSSHLIHDN